MGNSSSSESLPDDILNTEESQERVRSESPPPPPAEESDEVKVVKSKMLTHFNTQSATSDRTICNQIHDIDELLGSISEILSSERCLRDNYLAKFRRIQKLYKTLLKSEELSEVSIEQLSKNYIESVQSSHDVPVYLAFIENFTCCAQSVVDSYLPLTSVTINAIDASKPIDLLPCLLVGPWLMFVNDHGLIVPQIHTSGIYQCSVLSQYGLRVGELPKDLSELSSIIVAANTQNNTSRSIKQQNTKFIRDVLAIVSNEAISKDPFIEHILIKFEERTDEDSMELIFNQDLQQKYGLHEGKVVFTSHRDLDSFVKGLVVIDSDLHEHQPVLWGILKNIDSVFASRNLLTDGKNKKFNTVVGCPFEGLHESCSFRFVDI